MAYPTGIVKFMYVCTFAMKRLDVYLIRSFIPPFVVTFFIAVFVLILQVLWVYIDDIIGKGSSLLFILEMIFYLSMSLVPLALPIGVLISSVMVMGNLAERYELSSMKSAGISLLRIMTPLIIMVSLISIFSFVSSNYLIPIANLKGKTRLHDVRKQKPNLNLQAGVFNEDFEGYVIYVGGKSDDGQTIYDVMIYSSDYRNQLEVITAEEGRIFPTLDQKYLIMHLQNGRQYQESNDHNNPGNKPFIKGTFAQYQKRFDLSQFNIDRTDEASFSTNASVMQISKIHQAMDSVSKMRDERYNHFRDQVKVYLPFDSLSPANLPNESAGISPSQRLLDSARLKVPDLEQHYNHLTQDSTRLRNPSASLLSTYSPEDQAVLLSRVRSMARAVQGDAISQIHVQEELKKGQAKYELEIQLKFALACICLIFLFIGAPMGAIVRKGGFGYPLLVAISFFMLFMVLNMTFKSLAEKLIIPPWLGAWMPCIILFPVGALLTYKSLNDAKILDFERYIGPFIRKIMKVKKGRNG